MLVLIFRSYLPFFPAVAALSPPGVTDKMKSYIVALFALASAVVAQQQKTWLDWGLPECSVECLEKAVGSATKCSAADWNCFCIAENYRNTYDAAVGCVLAKCGQDVSIGTFLYSSFSSLNRLHT